MEGKEFRVEIPRTVLKVKTYKDATELAETLFKVGIADVQIVAFRPDSGSDY